MKYLRIWYLNSQAGIATENSNINQCESAIRQYEYEFEKKNEKDLKVLFTDFEVNLQNSFIRKIFFDAMKQETDYMSDFDVLFDLLLTFKTTILQEDYKLGKNVGYQIFKLIHQIHCSIGTDHIYSSFEQKYFNFITQKICDKILLNHLRELFSNSKENNANLTDQNEIIIIIHGAFYERKRINKILFDSENIAIVITKAEGQYIHETIV